MRVVVQRVSSASVDVDGERVATIGSGLLLLAGFTAGDNESVTAAMATKVAGLRLFPDDRDRLHHCLLDTGGAVLAVPQFTLYADTRRGRRPDFSEALEPGAASGLFDHFVTALGTAGIATVEQGVFGARMQVALVNDGPLTLLLERP